MKTHRTRCDSSVVLSSVIAAVAALVVTLAFWILLPLPLAGGDLPDYANVYRPTAQHLAAGLGLVDSDGRPAVTYPPGLPLLLAGVLTASRELAIPESAAVFGLLLVLSMAAAVLVFLLGRDLWGTIPALFATAVWITYPLTLWTWRHPASEPVFIPVLLLAVLLFWHSLAAPRVSRPRMFLVGALVGLATLIRPAAVGLGLVLALFLWCVTRGRQSRGSRVILVVALLAGNLLVLAPWEAYVLAKTGRPVVVTVNGVPSVRDGLTYAADDKGYRQATWTPAGARRVMTDLHAVFGEMDSYSSVVRELGGELLDHPVGVAELLLLKVARSWYATDSGQLEIPILLMQIVYLMLIVYASWMAWRRGGHYRTFVVLAWLIVGYFWLMTIMVVSMLRYMVPAMALLFVLLGALPGLHASLRRGREAPVSGAS